MFDRFKGTALIAPKGVVRLRGMRLSKVAQRGDVQVVHDVMSPTTMPEANSLIFAYMNGFLVDDDGKMHRCKTSEIEGLDKAMWILLGGLEKSGLHVDPRFVFGKKVDDGAV